MPVVGNDSGRFPIAQWLISSEGSLPNILAICLSTDDKDHKDDILGNKPDVKDLQRDERITTVVRSAGYIEQKRRAI